MGGQCRSPALGLQWDNVQKATAALLLSYQLYLVCLLSILLSLIFAPVLVCKKWWNEYSKNQEHYWLLTSTITFSQTQSVVFVQESYAEVRVHGLECQHPPTPLPLPMTLYVHSFFITEGNRYSYKDVYSYII